MSLVGELGRELFLRDVLEPVTDSYEHVVIDTPPNLGLLTVRRSFVQTWSWRRSRGGRSIASRNR
jgi:hypothetical protein